MNTLMWANPMTRWCLRHLLAVYGQEPPPGLDVDALAADFDRWRPGWALVPPISKLLADGDVGMGAMAEVTDLVAAVNRVTGAGS
jgi:phosphopantothenoylcysteine decarboxylase